jgi:hypothetical protein
MSFRSLVPAPQPKRLHLLQQLGHEAVPYIIRDDHDLRRLLDRFGAVALYTQENSVRIQHCDQIEDHAVYLLQDGKGSSVFNLEQAATESKDSRNKLSRAWKDHVSDQ